MMLDNIGRVIFPHDEIVYVTRRGSYMEMIHAKVLDTGEGWITARRLGSYYKGSDRVVRLTHSEYIAILSEDQLEGRSE